MTIVTVTPAAFAKEMHRRTQTKELRHYYTLLADKGYEHCLGEASASVIFMVETVEYPAGHLYTEAEILHGPDANPFRPLP